MGERCLSHEVREVVERVGDPLMSHIIQETGADALDVKRVVQEMVHRGELRQKEDPIDHDWSYRKGSNWARYA